MGTAGLKFERLRGLLERMKIAAELIEDDAAYDHCCLRLTSVRAPNLEAILEYENQGQEPRLVRLTFFDSTKECPVWDPRREWDAASELQGARDDDPRKIVEWVEREYLGRTRVLRS
jgi:hypothetical protein